MARSRIKIALQSNPQNVPELMAAADVAVSAAGSTCWELCLLGLPSILIDVADNQSALAREMHRRGCAIHIGDKTVTAETLAQGLNSLCGSQNLRQSLSRHARDLVDGSGAERVVSILRGSPFLRLRRARAEDSRLLWEWANDPEVRAFSFSADPIPWETHVAWFAEKLDSSDSQRPAKCAIFIAEDNEGTAAGQIRFDACADGDWEVDVSIAKAMRGKRLASRLIENGVRAIHRLTPDAAIHAYVLPANAASVRAFERAAFQKVGMQQVRGREAIHLTREKKSSAHS